MPSFCNHMDFTLKVMVPLVHGLHLVDGERNAIMRYIHEAMEKARKTMMKSFNEIESNKDVFTVTDNKWTSQLHRSLHEEVGTK